MTLGLKFQDGFFKISFMQNAGEKRVHPLHTCHVVCNEIVDQSWIV